MKRIKAERLRRGLTLRQVSAMARIPQSDVSRVERGMLIPYPTHAKRLGEALGIPPERLLDEVELQALPLSPASPKHDRRPKAAAV